MSSPVAAMSGVPITLLDTVTTGTSEVVAPPPSFRHHNFFITTPAGVNAGKVQMEASIDPDYAGTWAAVGAETTVVASATLLISHSGLLDFVRARVTTTISGGAGPSVTVVYEGAKSY